MALFDTLLSNMQSMGIFQFLFPFLLALAIFYGILTWTMGERLKKGPTSLISIILAFFVMLFAASQPGIVPFLTILSGTTGIVATGILVIAILLGLMGFKIETLTGGEKGHMKWFFIFAIIILGLILFAGAGGNTFIPNVFISSDLTTAVIVIVIIAVAMYFMTMGEEPKKEEAPKQK
jgi:hypothetical protein